MAELFNINKYALGSALNKDGCTHHMNGQPYTYFTVPENRLCELFRGIATKYPESPYCLSEHAPEMCRVFFDIDVPEEKHLTMEYLDTCIYALTRWLKRSDISKGITILDNKQRDSFCGSMSEQAPFAVFPANYHGHTAGYKFDPYLCLIAFHAHSPDNCRFHLVFPWLFANRVSFSHRVNEFIGPASLGTVKIVDSFSKYDIDTGVNLKGALRAVLNCNAGEPSNVYHLFGMSYDNAVHNRCVPLVSEVLGLNIVQRRDRTQVGMDPLLYMIQTAAMDHCTASEEDKAKIASMFSLLPDYKSINKAPEAPVAVHPWTFVPAERAHPPDQSMSQDSQDSDPFACSVQTMAIDDYLSCPASSTHMDVDEEPDVEVNPGCAEPIEQKDVDRFLNLRKPREPDSRYLSLEKLKIMVTAPDGTEKMIRDQFAASFMSNRGEEWNPHLIGAECVAVADAERGGNRAKIAAASKLACFILNRYIAFVCPTGATSTVVRREYSEKDGEVSFIVCKDTAIRSWLAAGSEISFLGEKGYLTLDAYTCWVNSPYRLGFNSIAITEDPMADLNVLSLWRGLRYTNEDCQPWKNYKMIGARTKKVFSVNTVLSHIYTWLCAKDIHLYSYVIHWMAHVLQRPLIKTASALFFSSDEGVGKGMITLALCAIIGKKHSNTVSNVRDVFGDFADHLVAMIFLVFDEVESISAKEMGQLKAYITDPVIRSEGKYKECLYVTNLLNLVLNTNRSFTDGKAACMAVSAQERRMVMSRCDSAINTQSAYFSDMNAYLDSSNPNGGRGCLAFAAYLYSLNLRDFYPRAIPETAFKNSLKMAGAPTPHRWWQMCIRTGEIGTLNADNAVLNVPVELTSDVTLDDADADADATQSAVDVRSKKSPVYDYHKGKVIPLAGGIVILKAALHEYYKDWCEYNKEPLMNYQMFFSCMIEITKWDERMRVFKKGGKPIAMLLIPKPCILRVDFYKKYRNAMMDKQSGDVEADKAQPMLNVEVVPDIELNSAPAILTGDSIANRAMKPSTPKTSA